MRSYLAGTDVRVVLPLQDADGNPYAVSAVSYRVTDKDDADILALTSLTDFVPMSPEAVVTVLALHNQLPAGMLRDLRSVEFHCVVDGNRVLLSQSYVIQARDVLEVGVNSFQTLTTAEFNAGLVPGLAGWKTATEQDRIAALVQARLNICLLSFGNWNEYNQSSLSWPEGTHDKIFGPYDLSDLSASEYAALPDKFRQALCLAQLAEADAILGGDPTEERRRQGILLDTVGESKQMFRAGTPLRLPVSRRALSYLSRYVRMSKGIGRA